MNKQIIFRSACFVTIALSSISLSKAFAETTPPKQVTSVEGITEYQLDNGLRVLLYPDASRPTVTVNMVVLVGSRHEGYGETGMAHLLEHMNFKGLMLTRTFPRCCRITARSSTPRLRTIARTTTKRFLPAMKT